MHASRSVWVRLAIGGVVAFAALGGAASASAHTAWSVGVSLPGVEVGVAEPAPVYYPPAPVYSRPAPVYQAAPVYQPAPVYYRPAPPVVYAPAGYEPRYREEYRREWDGGRRWHHREWERSEYELRDDRRGWRDGD